MLDWSIPKSIKMLRGFLGLTSYYRRFIKDYSHIATPMTDLLKKDSFVWLEKATESFNALKQAMVIAPIFGFPYF